VIDPRIATIDSKRTATEVFFTIPKPEINTLNPSWVSDWLEVSRITSESIESENSWSEQAALSLIARELPNESALFIGSSRPIRDIEGFAKPRSGLAIFANRGLAGIDGNLSTIFGIATQFERSFGVVGDLTFLHDLSALANLPKANLTLFIIDNNGGGIFSTLPQAGVKGFDEIFGTPQNQDLARIAKAFNIEVEVVKSESDLSRVIAHDRLGVHFIIVEVPTREVNATQLKDVYARVSSALRIGLNLA
jgi:2-succinyl-5-enolpyruvyl-6-hydroxy-3-cyclohexene-1-carboxylate synthase